MFGTGFNLLVYSDGGADDDVSAVVGYDFAVPVIAVSWANAGGGTWGAAADWGPAAVFGGLTVNGDTVLIRGTLPGDSNLDRAVGFSDLVVLAQNYNGTGKQFADGDSNYDGAVTFTDLVALAQSYNGSLPGAAALATIAPRRRR